MDDLTNWGRESKLVSLIRPPRPSLNYRSKYLQRLLAEVEQKDKLILDIGSGGRRWTAKTIAFDIDRFENVNIVGEAQKLPLKDESLDFIVISAVLEHVREPYQVIKEIFRVLKNHGTVYVESPFLQPFHADPNDFQRFTIQGLKEQFKDFTVIDSGVCVGPFSSFTFFIRKFFTIFCTNSYLIKSIEFIVGWLTFWLKYFDWFLTRAKRLHIVAAGIYLLLRKE